MSSLDLWPIGNCQVSALIDRQGDQSSASAVVEIMLGTKNAVRNQRHSGGRL